MRARQIFSTPLQIGRAKESIVISSPPVCPVRLVHRCCCCRCPNRRRRRRRPIPASFETTNPHPRRRPFTMAASARLFAHVKGNRNYVIFVGACARASCWIYKYAHASTLFTPPPLLLACHNNIELPAESRWCRTRARARSAWIQRSPIPSGVVASLRRRLCVALHCVHACVCVGRLSGQSVISGVYNAHIRTHAIRT